MLNFYRRKLTDTVKNVKQKYTELAIKYGIRLRGKYQIKQPKEIESVCLKKMRRGLLILICLL